MWYLGAANSNTASYKLSICATLKTIAEGGTLTRTCEKATTTATAKIGLLRYGEVFASQIGDGQLTSTGIRLISIVTSTNTGYAVFSDNGSTGILQPSTNSYTTRPSIYLKSNVKISSGDGTPSNPFTLTM